MKTHTKNEKKRKFKCDYCNDFDYYSKEFIGKNVKKNMKEMSKTIYIIEKVINISCFLVSAFFLKNS